MKIHNPTPNNEEVVSADEILRETHKRLVKSFLDVIILAKLNEENAPIGAHNIMNFVHQEFGVLASLDSLWALLYSCEKDGLIKSSDIGGTKQYSLSIKGKNTLEIITREKPRIINLILEFLLIETPSF